MRKIIKESYRNIIKRGIAALSLFALLTFTSTACSNNTEFTKKETSAFSEIINSVINSESLTNKTEEMLTAEMKEKFPAVKKIFVTNDNKYLFISKPIAYNGAITLAVVIDADENKVIGTRIVKHIETEHYVRDFENDWFVGRFDDKNADKYLKLVHLEEKSDDEIVIITGATTTTEGVVNGVNACIGMYCETILKKEMPSVELKAKIIK